MHTHIVRMFVNSLCVHLLSRAVSFAFFILLQSSLSLTLSISLSPCLSLPSLSLICVRTSVRLQVYACVRVWMCGCVRICMLCAYVIQLVAEILTSVEYTPSAHGKIPVPCPLHTYNIHAYNIHTSINVTYIH